jgi:uncharacterized membrane protein
MAGAYPPDQIIGINDLFNKNKRFHISISPPYTGPIVQPHVRRVTMIKTMTFAAVHFSVAFGVAYAVTGSILVGGLIALVEPAINTVAYYFHEKAWSVFQGRRSLGLVLPSV